MFRYSWWIGFFLLFSVSCEKISREEGVLESNGGEISAVVSPSVNVASAVVATRNGEVRYNVEISRSVEERTKGLQNREHLDMDWGMWFEFEENTQNPFWMKEALISLDIIFIDSSFKVVDFFKNAVPQSTDLMVPDGLYRYVLEVNAGQIEEKGIAVGDSVELRLGP